MKDITLKDAQLEVDTWIKTIGVKYFSELTNMAILAEEVGEVARIISRTYGDQSFKDSDLHKNLGEELADVLFVTICLANQTGIDLNQEFHKSMVKRNERDLDRHKRNKKLSNS
jgi:NTP pyrophosphatase (non-canonical NTP hydrolase)